MKEARRTFDREFNPSKTEVELNYKSEHIRGLAHELQ